MDATDKLIRAVYATALQVEWKVFRASALELVGRELGAVAAGWLTQPDDQAGEFTAWPATASMSAADLQSLPLKEDKEQTVPAPFVPGAKQGLAVRVRHIDSGLSSRLLLAYSPGASMPSGESLPRIAGHLAEAYGLSLEQFILADERLSKMGRSNRGTAAMVDARGVIYAASKTFRALLAAEFGPGALQRLPFALPDNTDGEHASFGQGSLRFRAMRTNGSHLLIYARKAQPLDGLSPREQEIARALSSGKTFKSVARQCGIATSTVANHASRIYRKLGIYRREELFELLRASGQQKDIAA